MNRTDLCVELVDLCAGRDLAEDARAEYYRLLEFGTVDELRDVIEHLRARPVMHADELYPDPATTTAFVSAWAEYERRADERRRRIESTAERLGTAVALGLGTVADATRRLRELVSAVEEPGPVAVVPFKLADALAREGFAAGVRAARKVP